ncbi:hypothetical protein ES705_34253 [subsurface metagenome]
MTYTLALWLKAIGKMILLLPALLLVLLGNALMWLLLWMGVTGSLR